MVIGGKARISWDISLVLLLIAGGCSGKKIARRETGNPCAVPGSCESEKLLPLQGVGKNGSSPFAQEPRPALDEGSDDDTSEGLAPKAESRHDDDEEVSEVPPTLKEGEPGSPQLERKPDWTWEMGASSSNAKKLDFFNEPEATNLGNLFFAPQPSIAADGRTLQTGNVVLTTPKGLFWGGGIMVEGTIQELGGFFFLYPAKAGDKYDMMNYLREMGASERAERDTFPVTVTEENVTVAAGAFKALVYNLSWPEKGFTSKFYLAPGVGLVKIQDFDRPGKGMELLPPGTARRMSSQPSSPEFREFLKQMRAKGAAKRKAGLP